MKVLCTEQRTPEWFKVKRGRISASSASACLMQRSTKGRRALVDRIADDLEGVPDFDEHDTKPWFIDGVYYESFAIGWYQFSRDVDVEKTGFVVHDDFDWLGCSPDGLVGENGLVEAKYRKFLHTFDEHAKVGVTASVMPQIQTQLFVTDRAWCDYLNYWRDDDNEFEKGHVQRIHRNQAYIDNTLLPAFLSVWADVDTEIRRRDAQRKLAMQ